ncbi:hypothetical protein CXB51_004400 [Gossypium anomalum]|uniref:DUF7745 domain-containing protein n=1 Tax=Gossypium anomalum TaxID=47600 RepID=A0A8J5ZHW5_9ROSI|nr:hypothetical protein CXB51_004400 [Gossypium anomalum]
MVTPWWRYGGPAMDPKDSGSLLGCICTYVFVRFSSPYSHREMYSPELNSSERTQQEKGDSLTEGYVSELWDFTRISVDKHLFQALTQYWNPTYSCFTFGRVDLVTTVEEYMALLRCLKIQADKAYSRVANVMTFLKKLMNITGMSEQWVAARILECLSESRRGKIHRMYAAFVSMNLQVKDVEWRAPWMILDEILYYCGDFDWVHLLGIWGAVGYASILVLKQYRLRQFIPVTQGLAQCEFTYKGDNYKKKVCEISNVWNQTRRMKGFTAGPMMTPEYNWWWGKRLNDNIPIPS